MNDLIKNIDRLHTTALGIIRIKNNLSLGEVDVVAYCKKKVREASDISKQGKNYYVKNDNEVITINSHSYTIITAHKITK